MDNNCVKYCNEKFSPGHRFWLCVHSDLYLWDLTLSHGQQLCEIFRLEREKDVMAQTRCEQTDRQTGWFLYTPPNFVYWGYKKRLYIWHDYSSYDALSKDTKVYNHLTLNTTFALKWLFGIHFHQRHSLWTFRSTFCYQSVQHICCKEII